MYIEANEKVRKIFEKLEKVEDVSKLKFLIYTFNLLDNNQLNNKNEANPDLIENDDLIVFNMDSLELCRTFLTYFVSLYNIINKENQIYEDNGNVIGIEYNEVERAIISQFENLKFNDKLDVFKELFIRYDNETYFRRKITTLTFDANLNGFVLAREIDKFKK